MDARVVTQWSTVLLACPGFDPQQHMHKVSRQQMADSRWHSLPPVWFASSAFDFYSRGHTEGWSSSSWPSNEPFQGHTFSFRESQGL